MNNNITEDYCSFEVSKLLKEKGFKVPTSRYYTPDGKIVVNYEKSSGESEYNLDADDFYNNWNDGRLVDKDNCSCWGCKGNSKFFPPLSLPTHSIAIKWVRKNFGIHIRVHPNEDKKWIYTVYSFQLEDVKEVRWLALGGDYSSPEAATEAALSKTLQDLIK